MLSIKNVIVTPFIPIVCQGFGLSFQDVYFLVLGNDIPITAANEEEDEEGEQFDFDSGDEIPEADRQTILPTQEEANCIGT